MIEALLSIWVLLLAPILVTKMKESFLAKAITVIVVLALGIMIGIAWS